MAKTNQGLVSFALACVGRPYIYGTYGQILTERLLTQKAAQYPSRLGPDRVAYAREHYIGKRVSDCEGLIKNYLWSDSPDTAPVYNASQDLSANGAFDAATVKGKIGTIPERPGVCVRYSGHVGVYIGSGWVVEARGFNYGCVKTRLEDRNWTDWFEHPWIDYREETTCMVELPILRKGMKDTNGAVTSWQALMKLYNYKDDSGVLCEVDGKYGPKCEQCTKNVQKKHGLPQTGVVDSATWRALIV